MTDIVERLREWESAKPQLDSPQYLMDEAADEIERLRGLLRVFLDEDAGPSLSFYARVREALGE